MTELMRVQVQHTAACLSSGRSLSGCGCQSGAAPTSDSDLREEVAALAKELRDAGWNTVYETGVEFAQVLEGILAAHPAPEPDGDEVSQLGEIIWTTSRADESTISAMGADIVARAILAAGWRPPAREPECTCGEFAGSSVRYADCLVHGHPAREADTGDVDDLARVVGHVLSEYLDDAAPLNERRYIGAARHLLGGASPGLNAHFAARVAEVERERAQVTEWWKTEQALRRDVDARAEAAEAELAALRERIEGLIDAESITVHDGCCWPGACEDCEGGEYVSATVLRAALAEAGEDRG